jgi:hypothetical protein
MTRVSRLSPRSRPAVQERRKTAAVSILTWLFGPALGPATQESKRPLIPFSCFRMYHWNRFHFIDPECS